MKIDERRKLLCSGRREQEQQRTDEWSALWPNAEPASSNASSIDLKLDGRNKAQSRAPSADGSVSNEMWQTRWYLTALTFSSILLNALTSSSSSTQRVFDLRHLEIMSGSIVHERVHEMHVFDEYFSRNHLVSIRFDAISILLEFKICIIMQNRRHRFADTRKQLKLNERSPKETINVEKKKKKREKKTRIYDWMGIDEETAHCALERWAATASQ